MAKLEVSPSVPPRRKPRKIHRKYCEVIDRNCFFAEVDVEIRDWLFELQDDDRLSVALKAFKAIDQQNPLAAAHLEIINHTKKVKNNYGRAVCIRI